MATVLTLSPARSSTPFTPGSKSLLTTSTSEPRAYGRTESGRMDPDFARSSTNVRFAERKRSKGAPCLICAANRPEAPKATSTSIPVSALNREARIGITDWRSLAAAIRRGTGGRLRTAAGDEDDRQEPAEARHGGESFNRRRPRRPRRRCGCPGPARSTTLIVFFMNFTLPVGHQGVDAAGVLAPRGDVERQVAPVRVGLVAVRQAAPAVGLRVVGRPPVVVHRVPRRPVVPADALGGLELRRRRRQAQADRDVVGVGGQRRPARLVVARDEEDPRRVVGVGRRRRSSGWSR